MVSYAYFATQETTTTMFEFFIIPDEFEMPEPEQCHPVPLPTA